MRTARVVAIYEEFESFLKALKELKQMGAGRLATYTPVPCHEVDELLEQKTSPIRFFTLAGGALGFATGAALTVYCATAWPLIVGGKPIISVPPYLIIAFELTILFAAILSTLGYFLLSPFPGPGLKATYDPSFSEDKFGLFVESRDVEVARLQEVMKKHAATKIRLS